MLRRMIGVLVLLAALVAFVAVRGNRRTPSRGTQPAPEEQVGASVRRLDLRFECGESACAGWLYLPAGDSTPPAVVMAHGFAGTRDVGLPAIAERFARDGIAALVFDYRGFGASGGLPRQIVDPWEQLDDWRDALAFVRTRGDVDGSRLAIWGSSLGGGHALLIAAEDQNLRAVVAQAPLVDSSIEGDATFYGAAWVVRLLFTGWWDLLGSAFGRDPVTIHAIARSGDFGMIIDDGAYAAFEKLVGPDSTYRNSVAARSIFLFDDYNPAEQKASVRAPVLLIASRTDRFAPFAAVQAYAEGAANVTVETYDGDHFDVYSPPAATRAGDVAAKFLLAHLAPVK